MTDGGWWWAGFPQLEREVLVAFRRNLDHAYRAFSRSHGEALEGIFEPLLQLLVGLERLLLGAPWWTVLLAVCFLAHLAGRSWRITAGTFLALLCIGFLGMWEDTMSTLSMITVSTLLAVAFGVPAGVLMALSDRTRSVATPLLDVMQTLPAFVYLIPVVMLFGIGKVPGLLAVVIYAVPPVVRLTDLGIRLVDRQVLEASDAFGASRWQRLVGVQVPLAFPTIMAGINQTIMMALAMVVIASMIGVQGLGQPVLRAITNQYFTLGLLNGLAIVALAIIFDRVSQAYGNRLQRKHRPAHRG